MRKNSKGKKTKKNKFNDDLELYKSNKNTKNNLFRITDDEDDSSGASLSIGTDIFGDKEAFEKEEKERIARRDEVLDRKLFDVNVDYDPDKYDEDLYDRPIRYVGIAKEDHEENKKEKKKPKVQEPKAAAKVSEISEDQYRRPGRVTGSNLEEEKELIHVARKIEKEQKDEEDKAFENEKLAKQYIKKLTKLIKEDYDLCIGINYELDQIHIKIDDIIKEEDLDIQQEKIEELEKYIKDIKKRYDELIKNSKLKFDSIWDANHLDLKKLYERLEKKDFEKKDLNIELKDQSKYFIKYLKELEEIYFEVNLTIVAKGMELEEIEKQLEDYKVEQSKLKDLSDNIIEEITKVQSSIETISKNVGRVDFDTITRNNWGVNFGNIVEGAVRIAAGGLELMQGVFNPNIRNGAVRNMVAGFQQMFDFVEIEQTTQAIPDYDDFTYAIKQGLYNLDSTLISIKDVKSKVKYIKKEIFKDYDPQLKELKEWQELMQKLENVEGAINISEAIIENQKSELYSMERANENAKEIVRQRQRAA